MGLRRPVPKAVTSINWVREWKQTPKNTPSIQSVSKKQLFHPPNGMLQWSDERCASFIRNSAKQIREISKTRESYSISKLAHGKMLSSPGLLLSKGCKINILTFNEILKVLSWSGGYQSCINQLQVMKDQSIQPNNISYEHCLIAVSRSTSDHSVLSSVLQLMNDDGIEPTPGIYLAVLRFYAFQGNKKASNSVIEAMHVKQFPITPAAWGLLIHVQRDWSDGKMVFEEMLSLGGKPEEVHFQSLFSCAADSRDYGPAEKLYKAILNNGRDVSHPCWFDLFDTNITNISGIYASNILILSMFKVYCKSGCLSLAKSFLLTMKKSKTRISGLTYSYFAECYVVAARENLISSQEVDEGIATILEAAIASSILSSRRLYFECLRAVSITLNTTIALKIRKLAEAHGVREHGEFKKIFNELFLKAGEKPPPPAFSSPSVMFEQHLY